MGILNVTPDSFADGDRFFDHAAAIAHGLRLFEEGAAVVDVGGESTRPGADPIDALEECRRVLPVIEALAPHGRISIDTRKAEVAEAAIDAGATIVNDISASLWRVAAEANVAWIAVHMQGDPRTMQTDPRYRDVIDEVTAFLVERAEAALAAGVDEVWIDPGIGFGKTLRHNLDLLGHLDRLVATGFPVVVGASRKATIGRLMAASDARVHNPPLPGLPPSSLAEEAEDMAPIPVGERLVGSLVVATWAFQQGAAMVRAHDVRPTVHAATLVAT